MKKFLALMISWLLLYPAMAQYPVIRKVRVAIPSVEPVFTRALQDQDGYLWLGSEQGLFRFDGISFKSYYPVFDSLDFHVTALHEGNDGMLWIGCRDGKIYWLEHGTVTGFNPEEGTAGLAITDIITDQEGSVWWSTAGEGIYYLSDGRVYNINHEDGLNDNYVYDLEIDRDGLIWAGTDAGIASCRLEKGQKFVQSLNTSISLPDIIVKVIREDQDGNLWLGFQDGGAGYLPPDRSRFMTSYGSSGWTYGPVQDIAILGSEAWIASATGELLQTDAGKSSVVITNVIPGHQKLGKTYDLLGDREGNAWILSGSGLYRTTGNRIQVLDNSYDLLMENIHAIRYDVSDPGKIWFSNDKGLFSLLLPNGRARMYLENFKMPDFKVMCLFQDHYGFIWAGTFNYGVFRINPEDGSWTRITEDQGLVNNNVLAISGHDDTLWMATLGGASELVQQGSIPGRPFRITSHNRETGLVSNFIYSVFEDSYDQIWFGTDGDGISVLTKKGWISYNETNGLTDDVIYSVTGDKYGNIWVASASKGIFRFKDGIFTQFGINEGLSSLNITGIATLDEEVVIINDNGIDILHIPSGRIAHYGEEIGLSGISPDLNVISGDIEGNAWIGTKKGIVRYQAGHGAKSYGPETVIEEFSVYLEPRLMEQDMSLSYNDNHVSFNYSGLWYSNPEKVSYQVFLEGYDLGWIDTYDRNATYSSLPPGNYTFRVRSSLDKSFRNASEVNYSFVIRQPFWLKDWFIILLILFTGGLIYFVISFREERLRRIEREKKEKVEFEFQVLKNQVNPHFLFNSFSTLMSLIEEQPEQALKYTEKLSDFFRTILQYKDQQVISVEEELSLIESYFFLLKKRFGENLNLDVQLNKELKNTFIPPMTLQILIENAVKHNIISKDKPLFIRIYEDKGKLVVENNLQPKMINEVSTGIGLENIRNRYRLITKEEPIVEKTDIIFKVKLPEIK